MLKEFPRELVTVTPANLSFRGHPEVNNGEAQFAGIVVAGSIRQPSLTDIRKHLGKHEVGFALRGIF